MKGRRTAFILKKGQLIDYQRVGLFFIENKLK